MAMDNFDSSPKCLVCFCSIRIERTTNSDQFAIVFDNFCRLLKVDLIKPMQWNFEQDHIPFCEFCSSVVKKLKRLSDQIQSLQQQTSNTVNRIKHEMQTSGIDINELSANDRVNYFRHLVVEGSSGEEGTSVYDEVTSLNVDPMIEVETQLDRQDSIEFTFRKGINEPLQFEDADIEFEPLLTVKREDDSTTDCVVDVEPFPQDNLESVTVSTFLDTITPVFSAQELCCEPEELKQTDIADHHRCEFCEKTFREKLSLQFHLKQHLDEKKIKCEKYIGTFLSRNDLIVKQKEVDGNEMSKNCEIVNSERKLDINLTRFDVQLEEKEPGVKHDKKNNLCEVCEKGDASSEKFSNIHSLTCYKRIHLGEMKYKCDHCDKMFAKRSGLIVHRRRHTGERPFKCAVCFKTFVIYSSLAAHRKKHGEKSFKCDVCKNNFLTSRELMIHERIHTGERPYKCDVCNKTFAQSGNFANHKRIHTGERPYKCDVCLSAFTSSSHFWSHKKLHGTKKTVKM